MKQEKTNIEHLRAIIEKEMFNKEEALEFLDAVQDEMKEMEDNDAVRSELYSANERIMELENELEEMELGETIECGIGTIKWEADNLQLQEIMENLRDRIKHHGSLKVMRNLQMPVTT